MISHLIFGCLLAAAGILGAIIGRLDLRVAVKALQADNTLARAQRREYERECLSLRGELRNRDRARELGIDCDLEDYS